MLILAVARIKNQQQKLRCGNLNNQLITTNYLEED